MILIIDNYDSFTQNIRHLIDKKEEVTVKRPENITIEWIDKLNPSHIIISPGPGRPENAHISNNIIREFAGKIPIMGICLGMQCIGICFGANIISAVNICHGKSDCIKHDSKGIFNGLKTPLNGMRYHSLVIDKKSLTDELVITATSEDGEVMGIRHKYYSVEGVQFHPESVGSEHGRDIIANFISSNLKTTCISDKVKGLQNNKNLSKSSAKELMNEIITSRGNDIKKSSILTALNIKGVTSEELTGFAEALRENSICIKKPEEIKLLDTCGTGGDKSGTFNISTIASLVAAGAGCNVAKHGNRSVTSRCGSADLLEMLGVRLNIEPEIILRGLKKTGFTFLFAPSLYPLMKNISKLRKDIGIPTVFNILGPLINPLRAEYQVIGVYSRALMHTIAETMINLNITRGMVVHSRDGLDEISVNDKTDIIEINNNWSRSMTLDPGHFDIRECKPEALRADNLKTSCYIAESVLNGEKSPARDAVLLNAAAAIHVATDLNMEESMVRAAESIDKLKALDVLNKFAEVSGEQ